MGHELGMQKTHHDAKIQGQPFNTGDLVWLLCHGESLGNFIALGRDHSEWLNILRKLYIVCSMYMVNDGRWSITTA